MLVCLVTTAGMPLTHMKLPSLAQTVVPVCRRSRCSMYRRMQPTRVASVDQQANEESPDDGQMT